ncbi:hypothetical protein BV20DRAFT_692496 [Pilatotrama ljubarskyi]|nr:hypothetical protein BV20DRAFT_692496 [Pilatotrama ljubarskyi]
MAFCHSGLTRTVCEPCSRVMIALRLPQGTVFLTVEIRPREHRPVTNLLSVYRPRSLLARRQGSEAVQKSKLNSLRWRSSSGLKHDRSPADSWLGVNRPDEAAQPPLYMNAFAGGYQWLTTTINAGAESAAAGISPLVEPRSVGGRDDERE